jgi:hypothetical protein
MEEDRIPKKIFTQELEGTRRRGRPRKRWREEAEIDLQVLGVRRWRELVTDRTKWTDIVRQDKAHKRTVAPMEEEEEEIKWLAIQNQRESELLTQPFLRLETTMLNPTEVLYAPYRLN